MDLSKVFDCLPHNVIIAKLQAYGLDHDRLIKSYPSNWHQRIKLDLVFRSWIKTIIGVPQSSILGPLFINIFLNDLLLINLRSIVCNFADDNILYYCGETTENVFKNLQSDLRIVSKWFRINQMVANLGKFQYMLLGKHKLLKTEIEGFQLESAKSDNLLGITIDHNLTFDTHVSNICKTASERLSRIWNVLDEKQAKLLYNSFILL